MLVDGVEGVDEVEESKCEFGNFKWHFSQILNNLAKLQRHISSKHHIEMLWQNFKMLWQNCSDTSSMHHIEALWQKIVPAAKFQSSH